MNSRSSIIFSVDGLTTTPEQRGRRADTDKKHCIARLTAIEAEFSQINATAKIRALAAQRLEIAKRFLRSDELGACKYELQILELLGKRMDTESGNTDD